MILPVGQVLNRQAEEDLRVAYSNTRTPHDVGVQAGTLKVCEAVKSYWSAAVLLLFKKGGKRISSNYIGICMIDVEIWPVRERVLEVFGNDSIHRILRVTCINCVPSLELRRRLYPASIPALLVQRRLHRFGRAARRPDGELIKVSFLFRLHVT